MKEVAQKVHLLFGFFVTFSDHPHLERTTFFLSKSKPALPYICLFIFFSLFTQDSAGEEVNPVFRVFTQVFRSVEEACEGFFHLLWDAGRLNEKDEGTLDVGEVSYGRDKYLSFLRNNIVIRIFNAGPDDEGVPDDFVMQVD